MITDEKISTEIERADKLLAFYDKFVVKGSDFPLDKHFEGDTVNVGGVASAIFEAIANHKAYKITENGDSSISLFVDYEAPAERGESEDRTHTVLTLWTDAVTINIIFVEDDGEDCIQSQTVKTVVGGHGTGFDVTVVGMDNALYAAAINSAHRFILDKIIAFLDKTNV